MKDEKEIKDQEVDTEKQEKDALTEEKSERILLTEDMPNG